MFMVFPREMHFTEYIQAVPELTQYINDVKWVSYPAIRGHFYTDLFQRRVIILQGRARG